MDLSTLLSQAQTTLNELKEAHADEIAKLKAEHEKKLEAVRVIDSIARLDAVVAKADEADMPVHAYVLESVIRHMEASGYQLPVPLKVMEAMQGLANGRGQPLNILTQREACLLYTSPSPRDS